MAKRRKMPNQNALDARIQDCLYDFSREAEYVRDRLAKDIPAYNKLLSMKAVSFEEFALQQIAVERGEAYDMDHPPLPDCPVCHQRETVGTRGASRYHCRVCDCNFTANHNSISSGTKQDAVTWMKVLQCLLDFATISKVRDYCGISPSTYYKMRNRLFYAMQLVVEEVKLYGVVEVDNTFVRASYKGVNLEEGTDDEDSFFFDDAFVARDPRSRGEAYSYDEKNANHICVFTAIDDRGHVLARYAGIGVANYLVLKNYVPMEKFVPIVPGRDPFRKLLKERHHKPQSATGEATIMVADKEGAIKKYAYHAGLEFESHVFRRKGVQMKLAPGSHNIQRVNALHHRLKEFLRNCHHVSAKYLPGYLVLFEFIENTGASQEAINRVFQVRAKPNCDKPAAFFDNMYVVPNYLQEWLISDSPLKKLPPAKLLGYYLYDHIKHPEEYPEEEPIKMADIVREAGYTEKTIRKHYRELTNAGYRDLILEHFNKQLRRAKNGEKKPRKKSQRSVLTPEVFALYDEYYLIRSGPREQRITFQDFVDAKNKENGTTLKRTTLWERFKTIQKEGLRPPLPELGAKPSEMAYGRYVSPKELAILDDYNRIYLSMRQQGQLRPSHQEILRILSEKYGLAVSTISGAITYARAYRKEHPKEEE